ncbi:hypothetical protein [Roseateles puraquae]|uniref:Uncharacterized protein n=2 Tax=Pseudomonadota TaxID=1224 RepID=A0A254N2I4_9BURK|nr:hypothetical protein [Roseateles puraquae]MDG0857566.1 hypothetical protein [Roseateles puraquae]OWR02060.1 hypothetical protein CDO81_22310 [Roseateles puraquae]
MLFWNVKLPIFEHQSADVRAKDGKALVSVPAGKALSAGPLRIAGAIAKTLYANPQMSVGTQATLSGLALAQLQWLSTSTAASELRLLAQHTTNEIGLRDFSRGSRIGEYGQGLCALFVQDELGLPIVLDFGVLCDLLAVPRPKKTDPQPDFGGWLGPRYALVESKASLEAGSIKTELREGLEQCDAGVDHLDAYTKFLPVNIYSVLTAFQTDMAASGSAIHFADPTRDVPSIPDKLHDLVAKHYYRSALTALGARQRTLDDMLANRPFRAFTRRSLPASSFEGVPSRQPPAFLLGSGVPLSDFGTARVYVDRQIMDALRSGVAARYEAAVKQWRAALDESDLQPDGHVVAWGDGIVLELQAGRGERLPEFLR